MEKDRTDWKGSLKKGRKNGVEKRKKDGVQKGGKEGTKKGREIFGTERKRKDVRRWNVMRAWRRT